MRRHVRLYVNSGYTQNRGAMRMHTLISCGICTPRITSTHLVRALYPLDFEPDWFPDSVLFDELPICAELGSMI